MAVNHAVQRLRVEGDEIGVDIERLAVDNEFEGDRSVDTVELVRERFNLKGGDGVPPAAVRHDDQLE